MRPIKLLQYALFFILTSTRVLHGMSGDAEGTQSGIPRRPDVPELPRIARQAQLDAETAQVLAKIAQESHEQQQAKRRKTGKEKDTSQSPLSTTTAITAATSTASTQSTQESLQETGWTELGANWKDLRAVSTPLQPSRQSLQVPLWEKSEWEAILQAIDQKIAGEHSQEEAQKESEEWFRSYLPEVEDTLFGRDSNLVNTIAQRFFEREVTLDELTTSIARSPYTVRLRVIAGNEQYKVTQEQIELIGQRFPNVRELDFEGVELADEGLITLSKQPIAQAITRLTIRGLEGLSQDELYHAFHTITMSGTREYNPITAAGLPDISNFTKLKSLDLSGNSIGNKGLAALAKAPFASKLTELRVAYNGITTKGVQAHIDSFTNLRSLDISGNIAEDEGVIGNKGLAALAKAPCAGNLTELIIKGNDITAKGVQASIDSFTSLRNLDISANIIRDAGLDAIAKSPCAAQLIKLNVASNKIKAQGMQDAIDSFTNLTSLDISGNRIGDVGLEAIAKAPCAAQLTELEVGSNEITTKGVQDTIDSFTNLTNLNISGNKIGDAGLEALAKAPCAAHLIKLVLGITSITAAGLQATIDSFINLTSLDISANKIGDAGLAALAKAPFAAQLTELNLGVSGITAEGLRASIGAFTALTSLDVLHNTIGTEGLQVLAEQPFASQLSLDARYMKGVTREYLEGIRHKFRKFIVYQPEAWR